MRGKNGVLKHWELPSLTSKNDDGELQYKWVCGCGGVARKWQPTIKQAHRSFLGHAERDTFVKRDT